MMRTLEIFIVILIMTGAFMTASFFAVLPSPRQVSPLNLSRLALTTLETLDAENGLSSVAFETTNDTAWNELQVALSASLPSNVTFTVTPQKIGVTLYILNCSDSSGWWITGYTVQSIAQQLAGIFASYFEPSSIVMVQNTTQLGQLLNGQPLGNETLQNAIIINTCGEPVPIPQSYATLYSNDYPHYCYQLGNCTELYNWTWVSIVGYPFYYVTNTLALSGNQNGWGIYGITAINPNGLNAFLEGIDGQPYNNNGNWITDSPGVVTLTSTALANCSYYGIFPSPIQTSTRALPESVTAQYNLSIATNILNPTGGAIPGAVLNHIFKGAPDVTGSLFAVGLTRVPDTRLTALGILSDYNPALYKSEYTAAGTSKLVVLQLGLAGG